MAITLTDQILFANIGFLDSSLTNYYVSGSSVIVESTTQYCNRIPKSIRKLGANIIFLFPTGIYGISNFINNQSGFTSQYYSFVGDINNENLVSLNPITSDGTINNMISITQSEYDALNIKDSHTIYFIKTT